MSHTMGPWKFEVVDETDSLLGCKRLNGGNGSTVIDLSDEWTGYPECGQDLQMTISKDDAALIAAAPEMLGKIKRVEAEKAESEYALGFAVEAVERLEAEKAEMHELINEFLMTVPRGSFFAPLILRTETFIKKAMNDEVF